MYLYVCIMQAVTIKKKAVVAIVISNKKELKTGIFIIDEQNVVCP